jgi:ribosomal protein S18 acetylase RimI-like enzyme
MIRQTKAEDLKIVQALYRTVAEVSGGIIRTPDEITLDYVRDFWTHCQRDKGYSFVVVEAENIIAEIHTYGYGILAHRHILTDLTVCVHPDHQGKGLGKQLFMHLLDTIKQHRPDILRVELWVREHNTSAIKLYESVGFAQEGRFPDMIWNTNGAFDTPIMMVWRNPSFVK